MENLDSERDLIGDEINPILVTNFDLIAEWLLTVSLQL